MLTSFGIHTLVLKAPDGTDKPVDVQTTLLATERDRLDAEIAKFRKVVTSPTRTDHRYFVSLKAERKKIQRELKHIRRVVRKKADYELHESLGIMTKQEMKDWRVLQHKLDNMKQNLEHIGQQIAVLNETRFTGLHNRVKDETEVLSTAVLVYQGAMTEVQGIITKHYYRDKEVADKARVSSTTERETPLVGEVTV